MPQDFSFLDQALDDRISKNAYRKLSYQGKLIDFCSNDYLGFSRSEKIKILTHSTSKKHPLANGSTGSRLLTGHNPLIDEAESFIASFYGFESSLIYNSGYDANVGLISCIASKHDTIIYDQLVHASIRDGIRLSFANSFSFRHNDVDDLQKKIAAAQGRKFIVVESVYSMDGDDSKLAEINRICLDTDSYLIVDEAHATGVFGKNGRGLIDQLEIRDSIFAAVYTFGKAMGCHGAAILCNRKLREYLINFSRPFIYTTALPPHSIANILAAYQYISENIIEIHSLRKKINYFTEKIVTDNSLKKPWIPSCSAIQCFVIPENERVKSICLKLQESGFDIRPVLHPTVPRGKERIRVCLHAFNTEGEIDSMLSCLRSLLVL